MGAGQWTQFCREREGKQEVVAGQEAAALLVKPAFGLILVTLGTGAIAAGAIAAGAIAAGVGRKTPSAGQ
jgi:hypothetical protein